MKKAVSRLDGMTKNVGRAHSNAVKHGLAGDKVLAVFDVSPLGRKGARSTGRVVMMRRDVTIDIRRNALCLLFPMDCFEFESASLCK